MSPPADRGVTGDAGLYVHVPFCAAICPYCDFAVRRGDAARRASFADALVSEAATWREWALPFDTVYFGGGTPSLLSAELLERILAALREHLPVAADAWIALEANPEDVTPAAVAAWRGAGVRMLSLGVQSLDDERLRFLGRGHDGVRARRAIAEARDGGFDIVAVDLIYGLPDERPETWQRELDVVAALGPDHLSCYQLTVHEGTRFGWLREHGRFTELAEDAQADRFRATHEILATHGYEAYEVSNFARTPAHRSHHNAKYWRHAPYLGLGPSAHSFGGLEAGPQARRRWWNERSLSRWETRLAAGERPIAGSEDLTNSQLASEAILLGLRTRDGVDLALLAARHELDLVAERGSLITRLVEDRLVELRDGRLVATLEGWAVADGLAAMLAP